MLYWHANFQIPDSGVQSADVYAVVEGNNVFFYSDRNRTSLIFSREYDFSNVVDPYQYLLSLEEYANYTKV